MRLHYMIFIFIFIPAMAGCGLFESSDEEETGFTVDLDREVLSENNVITVTARNTSNLTINLLLSRTGDPHIERRSEGVWQRVEESPPPFDVTVFPLESGESRTREISYNYISRLSESAAGEYRVYYDFFPENEEETQSEHSDPFMVSPE